MLIPVGCNPDYQSLIILIEPKFLVNSLVLADFEEIISKNRPSKPSDRYGRDRLSLVPSTY
ncbi:hypothetical protein PLAN_30306 [Planktothrix rubescens CCAP 1459/22]|uniref:Uncharacterized protein n=1 Tax=Planktothrix rubescens CCAP 1459/22 TaxID=329571 RepID=A0A6J7ZLM1_PLARU|nr:hypothetical protein PLAN_30306 [Planktothrix rubescens NIVA-CYA 18]CAD0227364.1 hypothetical protein PL10110_310057 [Planktothrix agardhii]